MNRAAIVIIGGGAIGLSCAYQLALRKPGRIILLEKDQIGAGASGRAGGIITGLLWDRTGIVARKVSLELFRQLSAELDGYQFHDVGCLNLFTAAGWPERERLLPLYDELSVPYEIMSAADIRQWWPELQPEQEEIGLFDPLGGYSEPDAYLPALAQHCRELGVEIGEGEGVTEFVVTGETVRGVVTTSGQIAADVVVCTAHVWAIKLLAQLGYTVPMKTFVHQRYVTSARPQPLDIPAVNANPYGGYVRPAAGKRILVGGETAERAEFPAPELSFQMDKLNSPAGLKTQLKTTLIPLLPALVPTTWETEKVGLLAFSLDGDPLLGAVPGVNGLYVATAFHSGGFAYNPAVGLFMAEMITAGQTTVDLTPFAPDRFAPEDVKTYVGQTLQQKDVVTRRH